MRSKGGTRGHVDHEDTNPLQMSLFEQRGDDRP
jgi:hypothetical protein